MAKEIQKLGKLLPASFKSVPFLVTAESATRGKKVVIHEYPNSSKRFVEELGGLPAIMNLTCIIHGESFFEDRGEFERVLEEDGLGELVHPIYGSLQVKTGEYTVSSNQKRVGEFIFEVPFYISDEEIIPTPITNYASAVDGLFDSLFDAVNDGLENGYISPFDALGFGAVADTCLAFIDSINDAMDFIVDPIESFLASTNSALNRFESGLYRIIQTASGLRSSLENTYNNFRQIGPNIDNLLDAWGRITGFGKSVTERTAAGTTTIDPPATTDTDRPTDTESRAAIANNVQLIVSNTQIIAAAGLSQSIANTTFDNTDDLTAASAIIDDIAASIFEDDPLPLAEDPNIKLEFDNLKSAVKNVLDQQTARIWRISQVDPGRTSMSLMAYRYYGSLDNIDTLICINPLINVSNFNETVNAVTK